LKWTKKKNGDKKTALALNQVRGKWFSGRKRDSEKILQMKKRTENLLVTVREKKSTIRELGLSLLPRTGIAKEGTYEDLGPKEKKK